MLVVGDAVEPVIAQPALEDTTVFDRPSRSWSPWMVLALVVCILLLYAYPYWMLYARLGAGPAPPIVAADLNFYIGVSHMAAPVGGLMHNGWYGVDVPTAQFAYGRFHLAFSTYALLRSIVGGETATLVLWMLAWTALICAAALWLMRQAFPESTTVLLLFALTLLLLFDFDYAYLVLLKLLKLRPWSATSGLMPPFIRTFFPQVSIPLVLAYLGLQISALRQGRTKSGWLAWLAMALLQFLVLCSFPYATAVLAATTGVLLLLLLALFLAVCGMTFTFRPLIYLGKISYGLYVYHLLALLLIGLALGGKAETPAGFLVYWFGGLVLTIVLASASYRWLESPFLRSKAKFAAVKSRPV